MLKNQNNIYQNFIFHYEKSQQYPLGNFLSFRQIFHPQLEDKMYDKDINAVFLIMGIQQEILTPLLKTNLKKVLIYQMETDEQIEIKEYKDKIKIIEIQKYYFNSSGNKKYMQIFHPKIFLIKFQQSIRILIGTPNLFIGDWAIFNQIFYLKDYPLKTSKQKISPDNKFKKDLVYFIKKSLKNDYQSIQEYSDIKLEDYDIYLDDSFQLIWSLPGIHYRGNYRTSGLFHVENLMKKAKIKKKYTKQNTRLTYVTSSLGKFTVQFLKSLLIYFVPDLFDEEITKDDIKKMVRIIYPDKEMMKENEKFIAVFGTCLFYQQKDDENKVDDIFYKCKKKDKHKSFKEELFPHVKCILIQNSDIIDDDTIFYFGSHNCSLGAWGRIYGDIKIYNSNTELGMLMIPKEGSQQIKKQIIEDLIIEIQNPEKFTDKDELYENFQLIFFTNQTIQILSLICLQILNLKQCIHIKQLIYKERYQKLQLKLIRYFMFQKTIQQAKDFQIIKSIFVHKQHNKQQTFQQIKTITYF